MRYVAMSLAVLGLAAVVVGQDRRVEPAPEIRPMSEEQAAALRRGVARAAEGAATLAAAAEEFRKGGDEAWAKRTDQLAASAREASDGVARSFVLREKFISEKLAKVKAQIAEMQAEAARLEAELRQTHDALAGPGSP